MDGAMHATLLLGLSLPGGHLHHHYNTYYQTTCLSIAITYLFSHLLSGQSTHAFLSFWWCSVPPNIFTKPHSPEQGVIICVPKQHEPYHLFLTVWPRLLLCLLLACWFVLHPMVSITLLHDSLSSMASRLLPESCQYHTVLFKDKSSEISRLRLRWHISCEREVC